MLQHWVGRGGPPLEVVAVAVPARRRASHLRPRRGSWGKKFVTRGVMIPDPEPDFQPFVDSGSGFGSSKKRNHKIFRGVIILGLDPDLELNF